MVFSGDFDKVLAVCIIANGAVAMGDEVSMFFRSWGPASAWSRAP